MESTVICLGCQRKTTSQDIGLRGNQIYADSSFPLYELAVGYGYGILARLWFRSACDSIFVHQGAVSILLT